ncbi:unnamed protein product [Phytophthora fragariaefolia]|uniref:Unnamed protein product n=1 Tax=Phytophthora fragariaefolia TaxID=1490495 RepID=A0A9W6WSU4_9STRA|nr:unnamed protein product [Phytophthora fragariaefolia]
MPVDAPVFAFTYIGVSGSNRRFNEVNQDESAASQHGMYTYRIQGAMGHYLGSLLPRVDPLTNQPKPAKFAQIYIVDPDMQQRAERRRGIFADLDPGTLLDIEQIITESSHSRNSSSTTLRGYTKTRQKGQTSSIWCTGYMRSDRTRPRRRSGYFLNLDQIGKRVVLPSTHPGGPRHMFKSYQNAMAVVREFGKPDVFVTITCSPTWGEIQEKIPDVNQSAQDRPDVVARVYQMKLAAVRKDLDEGVLGRVQNRIYEVAFQKRGLPHAHILAILVEEDKPRTRSIINKLVSVTGLLECGIHALGERTSTVYDTY